MLDMDFPCMFEKKTITSLRLLLRTDAKRFVEQPVEFRQFCSQDLDTKHG